MIQLKCKVFMYNSRHMGLNVALISKELLVKFQEIVQSEPGEPVYIEIMSANKATAYAYAWHEDIEQFVDEEDLVVGLDRALLDTCLVDEGDSVQIRPLLSSEILLASSLVIKPIAESVSKIQTTSDLQFIKNRILAGENILKKDSRFLVPIEICDQTYGLKFQVVEAEPSNAPLKCDQNTALEFQNIRVKASQQENDQSFENIGGLKRQINLLREVIQLPMEHPDIFADLGISPPRGIILYGPPGNGKTMLARALATAIQASFFTINGPELVSELAGQGERKLRGVFEKAGQNAPSIIFFDEIDSFAGKRDSFASEFEVRMVGQLLSLMDGLLDRGNVTVIAATNRLNSIDPALRRPGRFDREIEVTLPSEDERLDILQKYVRKMTIDANVDLSVWAKKTSGYVGADLAALAREASIRCLRRVFRLSDTGHYEKCGDIVIINADFQNAFQELQPTTFRDLPSIVEFKYWDALIGMEKIKSRLLNLVEQPIKNSSLLKGIKLLPPSGILLVGKSQSGKKSLVLALGERLGIQCISARSLDFISHNGNQPNQSLSEVFRKARLASPSIILIERVDLMFSSQLKGERESFIFLEELSREIRVNRLYDNVFVFATAHSLEDISSSLTESSVFGHILHISLPTEEERKILIQEKIPQHYLRDPTQMLYSEIAETTEGLTFGEIICVCDECLRIFLISGKLDFHDFQDSINLLRESTSENRLQSKNSKED
ncbi:AAA family ATPase [Oscillatoria laete-virens NRMC-F 0139]|nr:AAA family ATPase [Oscillatoria laete-virens]MDL5052664.1 AAA family ATPase [Oscillatoria laete-virens NRMC-F 0139]